MKKYLANFKLSKKFILIFILLFVVVGVTLIYSTNAASKVVSYAKFKTYYHTEPVTFGIRNNSSSPITIPNSAPWKVTDSNGASISTPVAAQVVTTLQPGQNKEWVWDQLNNGGAQVSPGTYIVKLSYFNQPTAIEPIGKHKLTVLSTALEIIPQLGSKGFFTFQWSGDNNSPGESMRTYFTNPQTVRNAIEAYYKINSMFPLGPLVDDRPQRSPYDGQWSWHLDPARSEMVEMSIELCDGRPSYVEGNLDYWLGKVTQFCPWGVRVSKLE